MPDATIQDIKDRLNIVDVIGEYLQLQKAGVNFKALCPFHNERTPSFYVSPQRQIWHCFGCGEGGDVFSFLMRYENLEFRDALRLLADKAGVVLPQYRPRDPKEQKEKDLLLRINDFAARVYHQLLVADPRGKEALEYLFTRGLGRQTIETWLIGFAPEDFHFLHHQLLKKNLEEDIIVKSGVCVRNEKGQLYDRFRGRITFPVFNYFGEAVGFSARILPKFDDGKTGKYINSPETLIYNKSRELFGMYFAKDAIRQKDEAVVVEGQMDCISAHQAGFSNTVATSGTAITSEQLARLGRLTKNLKFCFDADEAGLKASRRAGELALQKGFRLKVINLRSPIFSAKTQAVGSKSILSADAESGRSWPKDPDELIKKSPALWKKAIGEAVWFLDFYIRLAKEKFPQDPLEQKHYISQEVLPFLGFIADSLEQDHYIHELVKQFGISESVIRRQIKGQKPTVGTAEESILIAGGGHNWLALEKEVLGGLINSEAFRQSVVSELEPEDFEHPEIRELVKAILTARPEPAAVSVLAKESQFMVESLQEQLGAEALKKRLFKSFSQLKVNSLKKKQKILQNELSRAEALSDVELLRKLQNEFARISQLRAEWEKK